MSAAWKVNFSILPTDQLPLPFWLFFIPPSLFPQIQFTYKFIQ